MKNLKLKNIFAIIKGALIGVVVNLLAILILAIILKFVDIPLNVISYVNNAIKILSIFSMMLCIKKFTSGNLLISSLIGGVVFAGLSFVIFSSLNGGFVFDATLAYDVIFAIIASIVACVIINILKRKSV